MQVALLQLVQAAGSLALLLPSTAVQLLAAPWL
jgi:hypothetical protein